MRNGETGVYPAPTELEKEGRTIDLLRDEVVASILLPRVLTSATPEKCMGDTVVAPIPLSEHVWVYWA